MENQVSLDLMVFLGVLGVLVPKAPRETLACGDNQDQMETRVPREKMVAQETLVLMGLEDRMGTLASRVPEDLMEIQDHLEVLDFLASKGLRVPKDRKEKLVPRFVNPRVLPVVVKRPFTEACVICVYNF